MVSMKAASSEGGMEWGGGVGWGGYASGSKRKE